MSTSLSPSKSDHQNVDEIHFSTRLRNIILCAVGWCCTISALFIQVTATTVVAKNLKSQELSTVPLGLVPGTAFLSTILLSKLMDRFSKKLVFVTCACLGLAGGCIVLLGNETDSYELICLGSVPQGVAYAAANNFRFLAADFSTKEFLPKAMAISVLGGVLAPLIGPEFARSARDWFPEKDFRGSYLVLVGVFAVELLAVLLLQFDVLKRLEATEENTLQISKMEKAKDSTSSIPIDGSDVNLLKLEQVKAAEGEPGTPSKTAKPKRTLAQVMKATPQVTLWTATSMALSYGGMAGLMAATPLAMNADGHDFDASTLAIELHMLGMFVPSLFTGHIVNYLKPHNTAAIGWMVQILGNLVFMSSRSAAVYTTSIALVGFGWNFVYVSASAVIAKSTQPEDRNLVRASSDMLALLSLATVMISSGFLFDGAGWDHFLIVYLVAHFIGILTVAKWCYDSH
mmetsp:Transcript_31290/g.43368  ORF Transcript_31290/g.43368 Transcript_31290/m.43368 type:complete len:458 (+) Transcript_31290:77-1450(+)